MLAMTPPARSNHIGQSVAPPQVNQHPIIDWYRASTSSSFEERMVTVQFLGNRGDIDMIDAAKVSERLPQVEGSMEVTARSHTIVLSEVHSEVSSQAFTDRSSQEPPLTNSIYSIGSSGISPSTGMASACSGFPLLDLEEGNILHPPPAGLECAFSFRGCPFVSEDFEVWKPHCLSHFFPHPPPDRISCPLCDFEKGPYSSGWEAWEVRLNHIAREHHRMGYSLAAGRPDFALCKYLMQKRLITMAEYKDLLGNNGRRPHGGQYTTDNMSHERRRR